MAVQQDHLRFLQGKIGEIKVAMFRPEMDSELQLPPNIISTIKTDDDGNIWFFTSYKGIYAQQMDPGFYAYLDYNQKGGAYRLCISGKATLVQDDPADHASRLHAHHGIGSNYVLIKLKIMHAEYFENKSLQASSLKTRIIDFFSEMFTAHHYRQFDFS